MAKMANFSVLAILAILAILRRTYYTKHLSPAGTKNGASLNSPAPVRDFLRGPPRPEEEGGNEFKDTP
jgi:hypothetical protein